MIDVNFTDASIQLDTLLIPDSSIVYSTTKMSFEADRLLPTDIITEWYTIKTAQSLLYHVVICRLFIECSN
jgi:hypothetical protein